MGLRKRRRLPDSLLEHLSDARAAAAQSDAYSGKHDGIMAATRCLGWDSFEVIAQVDDFDTRNPRDSVLRPCCRTNPAGGHTGTCLESLMMSGRENFGPLPRSMLAGQ